MRINAGHTSETSKADSNGARFVWKMKFCAMVQSSVLVRTHGLEHNELISFTSDQ